MTDFICISGYDQPGHGVRTKPSRPSRCPMSPSAMPPVLKPLLPHWPKSIRTSIAKKLSAIGSWLCDCAVRLRLE